jgi:ABC-2 type transport system permease protein
MFNQLRLAWEVCRKDLRLFWVDRRGVLLCFTVPIILASLFGLIFRNTSKGEIEAFEAGLVVESDSELAQAVVASLEEQSILKLQRMDMEQARQKVATREAPVALILPKEFGKGSTDILDPKTPSAPVKPIVLHASGNEMQARLAEGILAEAVARRTADRFLATLRSMGLPGTQAMADKFQDLGRVQRVCASGTERDQAVFGHSFCGMTLQYLLFLGMDCGLLLLRERRLGIWRRLTTTPAFPATLMAGRALATTLIALAQLSVSFAFAWLIFGVTISGSVLGFAIMALSVSLLAASTGLLVASIGGNESRARSVAILVILALSMLGGLWLPPFLMPSWLRSLGVLLPTSWALAGLEAATWQGGGFATALLNAGVVLLFSAGFLVLAVIGFQRAQSRASLRGGLG